MKPFDQMHPIRGNFGDPRTVFAGPPTRATLYNGAGSVAFHAGVDIVGADGTAVYPVRSGVVTYSRAAHELCLAALLPADVCDHDKHGHD